MAHSAEKTLYSTANICDQCGACCKTFPIFASEEDSNLEPLIKNEACQIAEWHITEEKKFQLHPLPFRNSCCFLKEDNLCSIYSTRPQVCRRFSAGSEQCNEARSRVGLPPLELTQASKTESNENANQKY